MDQVLVFGTIAGATVAWAIVETWRLAGASGAHIAPRLLWSAGATLATVHSAAAYGMFHSWSHAAAVAATAQHTAALTGLAWGGGLYFNYAFLVAWIVDVAWWWVAPQTYPAARSQRGRGGFPVFYSTAMRAFLWFMFLNGAVVFADGGMRVLGILAVGIVSIAWSMRFFRQTAPAP